MANRAPNVFIISPSTVHPLDVLDANMEGGGQQQETESKWLLPANLLRHVLNVAYYLGLHPYKFTYHGVFSKERKICQQVICAFLHVLMVYGSFVLVVDAIPDKVKAVKHPTLYFSYVLEVSGFVFVLLFIKSFWIDSEKFLNILQVLQKNKELPHIHILIKKPWIVSAFCLHLLIKLVYFLLIGYYMVIPISNLSPSTFFRRSVVVGRHFFLFRPMQNSSVIPDWDNITTVDGFVGLLNGGRSSVTFSMYELFKMIILACALILWFACSSLATNVEALEKGDKTWLQVYQQFQAIQRLSIVVNKALGNKILCYMIVYLAYFSINLNNLIVSKSYLARLTNLQACTHMTMFFYYSADIRKKVDSVYDWIQKDGNARHVTDEQERTIRQERDTKQIGIHAGKYFAITFGIIYAFLGLTITFFLICAADN